MKSLSLMTDGINGADLGVLGECQYAVGIMPDGDMPSVYRRRASDVGTYGGWRWECSTLHPFQNLRAPLMAELAERLTAASR